MDNVQLNTDIIEYCLYKNYKKQHKKQMLQLFDKNWKLHAVDLYKMKTLTSSFFLKLNKVYIRPSKIHGLGVFAKRDTEKGELLTFYPVDLVEYYPDTTDDICFQRLSKRYKKNFGMSFKRGNSIRLSEKYKIYSEPYFKNTDYLGHFINDGAKCPPNNPKGAEIYQKISSLKANCALVPFKEMLHLPIVATRDIKKDEELLMNYGVDRWSSNTK
jgi:SET domain-containing protein